MLLQYPEKINQCSRTWTNAARLGTFTLDNRDHFIFTRQQSRPSFSFRPTHPFQRSFYTLHRRALPPIKVALNYEMFTFSEEERWAMLLTTFAGLSTSLGAIIAVRFHLLFFY